MKPLTPYVARLRAETDRRRPSLRSRQRGRRIDLAMVRQLLAVGMVGKSIAKALGVSRATLTTCLREAGRSLVEMKRQQRKSTPGVVGRGSGPAASPGRERATDDPRKNPRGARAASPSPSVGGAGVPTRGGAA